MLKKGDKAPDFKLASNEGEMVSLKAFKGKNVILYFYPKDMTPGCTVEACDFRDALSKIKKTNTVILGLSRDSVERHKKFAAKENLNFPLLSDEEGAVCKAYGVWQEKMLYGKKFMGIVRTTFVIGKTGKIQKVFEKVKVKEHVKEVLETLKEME